MTDTTRELIQRMAKELDQYRQFLMDDRRETHPLANEARTALAQPEPEGLTDDHGCRMESITVELTYFKRNGKFYDAGKFLASMHTPLYRIWEKVRYMQEQGNLPGLIDGAGKEFNILVNAPGHPHDHPHIVMTTYTSEGG